MTRALLALATAGILGACSLLGSNVFDLEVGDCFDDGDLEAGSVTEVNNVPLVECAEPHDNEVYAVFDHPESEGFPGDAEMQTFATDECLALFEAYVGRDYSTSVLDFGWIVPTEASWDQGDREVTCYLYDFEFAKLTGSMKDSGV